MGSSGCYVWLVGLVFWGLLWYGRDDLGPKWTWTLVFLWLAGWGISTLLPGFSGFFMPVVALLDIVLVLVVFQGDVRIS
jgi:hypothetical protein